MDDAFENRDMLGVAFRRVNLGEASFNDVNLGAASFDNVNLRDASIRDANLANLHIENANIAGLVIFGIRVDVLIERELDRRDPARAELRMGDIHEPAEVHRVMTRLDHLRRAFYEMLRQMPGDELTQHPGPDRWSALEHVRHLVFAEDMYVNRWLLRNDKPWCGLGHLPPFLAGNPAFADVGQEPTDDLEIVLAAWDRVHRDLQAYLPTITPEVLQQDTSDVDFGQGTVGAVLQGMAQHDLAHIRMAEAAIGDARSALWG
jgi:hypothetical protein